jgi:uncharacterized protein (UPF0335 family)
MNSVCNFEAPTHLGGTPKHGLPVLVPKSFAAPQWSFGDDANLRAWHGKKALKQIAHDLNRSLDSVKGRLFRLGLVQAKARSFSWDEAKESKLRELHADGVAMRVIADEIGAFAKDQLKAIIERVERLEEEKKTISDDIRDIYAESKGNGYDVKALRTIVRLRKQDANERAEQETILELYMQSLGMHLLSPGFRRGLQGWLLRISRSQRAMGGRCKSKDQGRS